MILISEYGAGAHGNIIAFILAGCCHRLVRILGLDDKHEISVGSGPKACEQESRRRLMWSCIILDSIVGSGVDANNPSEDSLPKIPLPASEFEFLSQVPNQQESLRLEIMENPGAIQTVGYRGQIIYLAQLRTQVLRYVGFFLSLS